MASHRRREMIDERLARMARDDRAKRIQGDNVPVANSHISLYAFDSTGFSAWAPPTTQPDTWHIPYPDGDPGGTPDDDAHVRLGDAITVSPEGWWLRINRSGLYLLTMHTFFSYSYTGPPAAAVLARVMISRARISGGGEPTDEQAPADDLAETLIMDWVDVNPFPDATPKSLADAAKTTVIAEGWSLRHQIQLFAIDSGGVPIVGESFSAATVRADTDVTMLSNLPGLELPEF